MDDQYQEEIYDNYRRLHDEHGESWESIAKRVEAQNDTKLAAWLRSQDAAEAPEGTEPAAQVQGRRALKAETADASAGETAAADGAAAAEAAAGAEA
ncbi:hypothetical protein SPF06_07065 [Sinomonas sp. JGH33]|uniref:SANT domain-containing protein n=1 Tax=Sinomonas terricola TaxID=3110330 RepID=A0ABU5T490_9MICC|nr:hypothetical protein [Sinomonas sp. JGH33]MEA5454477.1 hypothetical protein [Sinomonas sp. JGH33]